MPDVAAQFREYIRLDRKHSSGGLTAAELERWTRLKRSLGRRFSPGPSNEQSVGPEYQSDPPGMGMQFLDMDDVVRRRFDEFYEEILQAAARRSDLRRGAAE